MNTTRAALLMSAVILCGCATRQAQRPNADSSRGFTPALERPGLGTSWGELRESWVEPAQFVRASPSQPDEQARIYYNDREGATAMLAFLHGESHDASGLRPAQGGALRFGIRDGVGAWLGCREARGRRIATGEHGTRYEVVLKNDARHAVEVLVSVDGLDAMDGGPASFKKRGYVLAPSETLAVEGFRTSRSTVAAFRFGGISGSYGQRRHGDATNAGVIGVAVFNEKRRPSPADRTDSPDHAWRAAASKPGGDTHHFSTPPDA